MPIRLIGIVCLILLAAGCRPGNADAIPTQVPEPPIVVTPRPTHRPTPTPIPSPTAVPATKVPVITPSPENTSQQHTNGNGEQDQSDNSGNASLDKSNEPIPTATLVPTPTLQPTPAIKVTPTPRWRPAPKPQGVVGYSGFDVAGPTIRNNILRMSAVINGHGIVPSEVQVWQSLRQDDNGGRCPTDKPIALIANSSGGGSSQIQWEYCSYLGAKPLIQVDSVPWIAGTWNYSERPRRRTTEPYLADWSIAVSLSDDRVEALEYDHPAGYTIVVFAGDLLLGKMWVEF